MGVDEGIRRIWFRIEGKKESDPEYSN